MATYQNGGGMVLANLGGPLERLQQFFEEIFCAARAASADSDWALRDSQRCGRLTFIARQHLVALAAGHELQVQIAAKVELAPQNGVVSISRSCVFTPPPAMPLN